MSLRMCAYFDWVSYEVRGRERGKIMAGRPSSALRGSDTVPHDQVVFCFHRAMLGLAGRLFLLAHRAAIHNPRCAVFFDERYTRAK